MTVDDRLGFPVCRCPECGRFHPAGVGVSASGTWVRRLATLLLFAWVGIVLAGTAALWLVMGAASAETVEAYATPVLVTDDGRPVDAAHLTAMPAAHPYHVAMLLHPVRGGPAVADDAYDQSNPYQFGGGGGGNSATYAELHEAGPGPAAWLWLSAGSLALGTVAGGLCVTLLWHWPRRRYLWCLPAPLVPAVFLAVVYHATDQYQLVRGTAVARAAVAMAVQVAGVLVGIGFGRVVARAVARTIVPPKPRQLLAFLWQADGKPMPAA